MEVRQRNQPRIDPPSFQVLEDLWNIAYRRKWIISGCVLLFLLGSTILCVVLPKSYRSSTLILVENQKIPEEYVKAIVGGSIEERLTMIQQQVMSRTLLSRVIEEFKLYEDQIQRFGLEAAIDQMRASIDVQTVGASGGRGRNVEAFTISFSHEIPFTAMKVTGRLASQFIEENLKVREQLVEGASEFLEQELQMARTRLEAQEQAISQFKSKFMGELPEQTEANLRALDRLQKDISTTSEALQSVTERLGMNEKAIKEYQTTGVTDSTLTSGQLAGEPLLRRLKELEGRLNNLSAEYKETYPDIIQIKQEIEIIRSQLQEQNGDAGLKISKDGNQKYDPYLRELIKQRDETKIELGTLRERLHRLTSQIKEYEGRVERTPKREQELSVLRRDYENMKENYGSLVDKKLNARLAENLEKRQKGEQFRIIDPANLPEQPEKPDKVRIMLVGLALGCGLGFGVGYAWEHLLPTFRRPEDAESLLNLPMLAAIPSFRVAYKEPKSPSSLLGRPNEKEKGGGGTVRKRSLPYWPVKIWNPSRSVSKGRYYLPNPNMNLVAKWRPQSVVTEQFRVAASRLELMRLQGKSMVVVVTSSVKAEGKTASIVNLGYVLARDFNKSTLLIDGDVKCPMVHLYAGIDREPGLSELVYGRPLDRCLHQMGELPLWVVPAGNRNIKPFELFKIQRVAQFMEECRKRYEYILFDAPPILPMADIHVVAGMADVLVLVIRAGKTSQDVVLKALNRLKPNNGVGIIMTDLETESLPYYMRPEYYVRHTVEQVKM